MKNLFATLFLSFALSSVFAQAVPNNNFENWVTSNGLENPVSWATSNAKILFVTVITVTKDNTAPYSGTFCAKLQNVNPAGFSTVAPGLLTLGKFNLDVVAQTGTVSGGIPYNTLPENLQGNFKFFPVNGDSCMIAVGIYKTNIITGNRDTIGKGSLIIGDTINAWTPITVPINYTSFEVPDSMNIIIMSSTGTNPQSGTIMYVDNISLNGIVTTTSEIAKEESFEIFPNPAENSFSLKSNCSIFDPIQMSIYNCIGDEVFNAHLTTNNAVSEEYFIGNLKPGLYVVKLSNNQKSLLGKLIKK